MPSCRTNLPNCPSKGDPDDGQRFNWSKRWNKNTDNTDEGCSKTKKFQSSMDTFVQKVKI